MRSRSVTIIIGQLWVEVQDVSIGTDAQERLQEQRELDQTLAVADTRDRDISALVAR